MKKRVGRFDGAISGMGPLQTPKIYQSLNTQQAQTLTTLPQQTMNTQVPTLNTQADNIPTGKERYYSLPRTQTNSPLNGNKAALNIVNPYSMSPAIKGSNSQMIFSTRNSNHNPIVNPLPVNMQNPYLLKEITKMGDKPNRLASLASVNIMNS